MFFKVFRSNENIPLEPEHAYLIEDRWNDFGFRTLHTLFVTDENCKDHVIGQVKIGQYGMKSPSKYAPNFTSEFDAIDSSCFSLGQDYSYYENLLKLSERFRRKILKGLKDIAYNKSIRRKAMQEEVTKVSLLRNVSGGIVETQFSRLSHGKCFPNTCTD